jgi:heptosyltransferase-1
MGRRKKILIIKPSSLGDIVHSLPVLDVLHRCFPDPEIHWLVAKGFEGMLEGHPMLKKLWIIHKDQWKKIARIKSTVKELRKLFKDLKAENFDYAIDLQGLFRSGVIAKATGAPVRVGFAEAREGSRMFYTHTVAGGREVHAVDRYLKTAAFLGCDISEVRFPFPPFDSNLEAAPSEGNGYAVMCPGARKPVNRWPAERFGKLASMLPLKTVVIGGKGDRMLADEVVEASGGKARSIAGKTDLKGLIGIIKHARIMVTNDTGPMHIAAALGIPVFAIFGAANPARTGPYGDGHTVIRKEISCSPCYRRNCEEPVCMEMIKVKEVAAIINKFLEGQ